jgi:hypothetical protein
MKIAALLIPTIMDIPNETQAEILELNKPSGHFGGRLICRHS